jgi:xylitol oxidase
VGGATATGTHGSGNANGVLTSAVRGIRYVAADGDLHDVRQGEPDFDALAVGIGAFGVVVSLTLAVQPTYRARQDVYKHVTWDAALDRFDEITGAGYSVSVFTRWEPDLLGDVWVKTRLDADEDPVPDALLDGSRVVDANPLEGLPDLTVLGGVPGPWMERLPHFRLDGKPSFGDEIQSEYFVPRSDAAAALRAVRELAPVIQPVLFVSELRTAASDDLWLSGAYRRDFLAIHFTWHNDDAGVRAVLPLVEQALAPFGARPHWGKLHLFDAAAIARVHPRLADARAVFDRLDPERRFANEHLERVGVR